MAFTSLQTRLNIIGQISDRKHTALSVRHRFICDRVKNLYDSVFCSDVNAAGRTGVGEDTGITCTVFVCHRTVEYTRNQIFLPLFS